MFRIGLFQFRPRFGDPSGNCGRVIEALRAVEADLVVLPELAFTGYYFRDRAEVERLAQDPRRSDLVAELVSACRRGSLYLSAGFAERDGHRCYNSALLLGPRGIVDTYRKIHLFNEEKRWFDPGDRPLTVRRLRGVRVGTMICFDWVFPEVVRTLALRGMELLAHPSNLVLDYCQRTMVSRCLENGVFAATCNRIGRERRPHGELRFTGRSQILGTRGEVLFRAPKSTQVLHVESIDPRQARRKAITPRNHLLRDRRPEFYG